MCEPVKAPKSKFTPDLTKNNSRNGGLKVFSCLNNLSSSVRLIYTVDMNIHPNSGDTPKIWHTPQNPNSTATDRISLLSVERLGKNIIFNTTPSIAPRITLAMFRRIGVATSLRANPEPEADALTEEASATEIAML